jgi:hypothetical protein
MQVAVNKLVVSLPMPIFLVVEDVGWWQGRDGSANNEPFRIGFTRRHCLADYQALGRLNISCRVFRESFCRPPYTTVSAMAATPCRRFFTITE